MYQLDDFRTSTPPQNCQLIVSISNSNKYCNDFVGELTFQNRLVQIFCEINSDRDADADGLEERLAELAPFSSLLGFRGIRKPVSVSEIVTETGSRTENRLRFSVFGFRDQVVCRAGREFGPRR
jgi:hypothetical protein